MNKKGKEKYCRIVNEMENEVEFLLNIFHFDYKCAMVPIYLFK